MKRWFIFKHTDDFMCSYTTNPYIATMYMLHVNNSAIHCEIFDGDEYDFCEYVNDNFIEEISPDDELHIGHTNGFIQIWTIYNDTLLTSSEYEVGANERAVNKLLLALTNLHRYSKYFKCEGFKEILGAIFKMYWEELRRYINNEHIDELPFCELYVMLQEGFIFDINERVENQEEILNGIQEFIYSNQGEEY